MSEIKIGVPIIIDGHEVIVFRDVIGTESLKSSRDTEVLTIVEPAAHNGRPPIYIDESELLRIREAYPSLPVYGLWQLLFANDLVPLGNEVIVYPMGEDKGLFIRLNASLDMNDPASIMASSEYIDNFISDHLEYNLRRDATRLSVQLEGLKLPQSPAFTRAELYEKQKAIQTRLWFVVGAISLLMLLGCGVLNYMLSARYDQQMALYATQTSELKALMVRMDELSAQRLVSRPDNSLSLTRLADVATYDPAVTTPKSEIDGIPEGYQPSISGAEHLLISSAGFIADISARYPWLTVIKTPTTKVVFRFASDKEQVEVQ